MGMYTGLRGTVVIKEQLRSALQTALFEERSWKRMGDISEAFTKFASHSRAQFIPFGMVSYMPCDWEEEHDYDAVTGVLSFCCSLKNYNGEIEDFLECLPDIADWWNLESLYEEHDSPTKHRSNT